jgi:hypothetical protein
MLEQITYFDLCKTFLTRRSFCELVMKSTCPSGIGAKDMTMEQFTELQHLAHINLLRGCMLDDVTFDHLINRGANDEEP